MQLSLTPVLLLIELAFLFALLRRGGTASHPLRPLIYFTWIAVYAVLVSYLGYLGIYTAEPLLPTAPALWLQSITIGALVLPVLASSGLRGDLRQAVDATPPQTFIRFQMLRLTAVGAL